jgi:hypothetical protein
MPPTGGLKDNNFSFRLYQDKRLAKDLKRNGFTVIEVSYYSFFLNWGDRLLPPASWAVRAESLKNSKIQRRLGRNFIVLMQKI